MSKTKIERWVFTESELQHPETCKGYDEFLASNPVPDLMPGWELSVIVYRNGEVSNRWEDGTRGIPQEIAELANDVESLYKDIPPCEVEYADHWRDVITDDDGNFVRFEDAHVSRC